MFEPAALDQLVQERDAGRRLVHDGRHVHGRRKCRWNLLDQVVEVCADERSTVAVVQQFLSMK